MTLITQDDTSWYMIILENTPMINFHWIFRYNVVIFLSYFLSMIITLSYFSFIFFIHDHNMNKSNSSGSKARQKPDLLIPIVQNNQPGKINKSRNDVQLPNIVAYCFGLYTEIPGQRVVELYPALKERSHIIKSGLTSGSH